MGRLRESKWVYVLLSVLLATLFWLYVRTDQDYTQQKTVPGVPVQISGTRFLNSQDFTVSSISQETVTVRLEGPVSVLDKLSRKNLSVTVDVSQCLGEGDYSLDYRLNWPNNINVEGVVELEKQPTQLTVMVEKLYSESFDVEFQLKGSVAKGYQAGTPTISVESVKVSGTVEQVSQVARVVAVLEAEDLSERFSGELPLRLLDAKGNELTELDVNLSDETAYVTVPVVVVKEIPLRVTLIPGGGASEENGTVKVDIQPKTITVSGPESDLAALDELYLGSIDLSKVIGSAAKTFPITPAAGLENVSGISEAKVMVAVEGLSTRTIEVDNIMVINVPDGYTGDPATRACSVVVRGSEEALESVDANQIRIVADLSQTAAAGTYSVPAKVSLDAGSDVGVIGEYNIVVNITR